VHVQLHVPEKTSSL